MILFGRDGEVAALSAALRDNRVVVVSGPPGIGKSALVGALDRPDVVRCALVDARDADDAMRVIARALDVAIAPSATEEEVVARIGRAMAHRGKAAVVLDDVDRASGAVVRMLRAWTDLAASVRFVLTSRKRLLPGKAHRLEVPPLSTNAGVKLFAERAGMRLDVASTKTVTAIVEALEGVPLAIELAASRATALSVTDIERLLAERLDLLEGSEQSLRSAFALSWDELADEDAATLAALSTFRGGFDLAAASAVLERSEVKTARAIERLVEHSLLRPREDAGRHALDESLRVYAREQLEARKESAAVRERHARHFSTLEAHDVESLERERGNLGDAFELALERRDGALAAALLRASGRLLLARGPLASFVERITRALALRPPARDRAELHLLRGTASIFHGRRDDALGDLRRARDAAKQGKDSRIFALATSRMGMIVGFKGKLKAAEALFAEATRAAARADDFTRGVVLKDRANVLAEHGKDEEAMAQLTRARALFHSAGDVREEGFVLLMLGMRLLDEGRLDDARRDLDAARDILRRAGDRRSEAWAMAMIGVVAAEAGDPSTARTRLDAALAAVRAVGDEHTEGLVQGHRGNVALEQGLLREAEEAYRAAITVLARAGDVGAEGAVTTALAAVDHELGRVPAAKEGFRRARALLEADARAARRDAWTVLSTVLEGEAAMRTAATAPKGKAEPEEVRFARRVLARRIEGRTAGTTRDGGAIVVAGDASWLRVPSGATVRLGRARALARIVRELALERVRHPGRPIAAEELVRAGWPDERIVPSAAKNRLHVSITRLRKLGLEDAILREADGYMFDPDVLVTVSDV